MTNEKWYGWVSDREFVDRIAYSTNEQVFTFVQAPTFGGWEEIQGEPSRVEERQIFVGGVRVGKELYWAGDGQWSSWLEIAPDTPGVTMRDA